jgi:hypothetical protein
VRATDGRRGIDAPPGVDAAFDTRDAPIYAIMPPMRDATGEAHTPDAGGDERDTLPVDTLPPAHEDASSTRLDSRTIYPILPATPSKRT